MTTDPHPPDLDESQPFRAGSTLRPMYESQVTILGEVLAVLECRRTAGTGNPVVTFEVSSASRRLDKVQGIWLDSSLRVQVTCFGDLAERVAPSVKVGDMVIACGRMVVREWTDEEGTRCTSYDLSATAIGQSLGCGWVEEPRLWPERVW